MSKSIILGLLGGIGSGKSTVAALLERMGASVLDADRQVGELLLDPEVRREIRTALGENVFHPDGRVDKAKLADRIFTHESDRAAINAIIHPRVRRRIREEIAAVRDREPEKVIVLDIPLLLGSELQSACDLMIMVRSRKALRLERIREARGWDAEELDRREACQPSVEEKAAAADVCIDNEGNLKELEERVSALLKKLLSKTDPS